MPIVIRTPGVHTGEHSEFDVYARTGDKRKRSPMLIEGQSVSNSGVAYEGKQDAGQKYCLVVKDSETGKLEIIDATLFETSSYIKSLREKDEEQVIRQSGVKNWQQRTALGEAFGTKKAKTAISDIVRNRLDAEMLEGLETAIVDNVKGRTAELPSSEQRQKHAEAERPIPPYNAESKEVSEIYPINNIVPANEYDQFSTVVDEIVELPASEALEKLVFKDSDFINARVEQALADDSQVKPKLHVLLYLSFLRAVYQNRRATSRDTLIEKIGALPSVLFDGIIERFTVPRAGKFGKSKTRSFVFDPFHTDKLLCYILALSLHANNFELDITPLAHELSSKTMKITNLLRNLGCNSRIASKEEANERKLSYNQAVSYRISTLEAPLSLPNVVKRKR